jgi:hypothetical protein
MKEFKFFIVAAAVVCGTAILIAAFIILFSYSGYSSNDKSNENAADKRSVVTDSAAE